VPREGRDTRREEEEDARSIRNLNARVRHDGGGATKHVPILQILRGGP
jgi:hypothetical protein